MNSKLLKNAGQAMKVQQNQVMSAEEQAEQMENAVSFLHNINDTNLAELDDMLSQAELLCNEYHISVNNLSLEEEREGEELAKIEIWEPIESNIKIDKTDVIDYKGEWERYMASVDNYANNHSIDIVSDPYASLLCQQQHDE